MYNILHLAASRGLRDARRPRPVVQPAGASHLALIARERPEAPRVAARRAPDARPHPSRPSPDSG